MKACERPGCDRVLPEDAPENRVYCSSRCRTAHWRLKRETPKRVKPSGRQVSYRKAVEAVAAAAYLHPLEVGDIPWAEAVAWAEDALGSALPERQRRSLR